MFLNATSGRDRNGPARPVSFYGRFVLFRPLPSEGVIEACVGSGHLSRHDRTELHVGFNRQPLGRRVPSSRHLPEFSGSWLRDNALTQPATGHDPVDVV